MGGRDGLSHPPADPRAGPLDAMAGWPVAQAGGVVVRLEGPGPGAVPAAVGQAGDVDAVLPWASVTKLLVTMAVLVAVEEGTVSLDDRAGPPGSTVRHLLAHASGLAPEGGAVLAPPGRRRIYSNAGFEVLAQHLASAAGMEVDTYVRLGVTEPLGMTATALAPGASPASGAWGSGRDLARLGAELLAPRLVSPATLASATATAFPGLAGVLPGFGRFDPCDWGLGFERRDAKAPHWTGPANSPATFGHFGQRAGFLWVDPGPGLACAVLSDGTFGPWAAEAWPALADAVVARWGGPERGGAAPVA